MVGCLDSLNTDLMQPYSDAKASHSICLPIQEWKDKIEKRFLCLGRMVERSTDSY